MNKAILLPMLVLAAAPVCAQSFPLKPIRLIIPFAPGGGTDITGRAIAQKLAVKLAPQEADLGELKIKISGCINACGHHHAGHIGILGVDRKGDENYQLLLGGSGAEDASLAKILGPGFDEDGIVVAVEKVVDCYKALRSDPAERLLDTYRRVGAAPIKEAVYG